jgi:hypothetical protein
MSTVIPDSKNLFGMVALSMGLITKEQIEECLEVQRQSRIPRRLGAIMLEREYLTDAQVRGVLRVQGKISRTANWPKTESGRRRLIGEILVERGYINRETLTSALRHQQLLRKKGLNTSLGELLLTVNKITPKQLSAALAVQAAT